MDNPDVMPRHEPTHPCRVLVLRTYRERNISMISVLISSQDQKLYHQVYVNLPIEATFARCIISSSTPPQIFKLYRE